MKKRLLMLSAAIILVLGSCSKNKDMPADCLLTEMVSLNNYKDVNVSPSNPLPPPSTAVYTYIRDARGRIVKTIRKAEAPWAGTTVITYTYSTTEIKKIQTITLDQDYVFSTIYKLDANNRIIADDSGGKYTYDNKGYLVEIQDISFITKYIYIDGNLTNSMRTSKDIEAYNTYNIEYGMDEAKSNLLLEEVGAYISGESLWVLKEYFGKSSKNLPIKIIDTNPYSSSMQTFSYAKDALGNIIKATVDASGVTTTFDYKYECK